MTTHNNIWITRTSGIPLHKQVSEILSAKIERGDWKAGDLIPTEKELCELFGLSRSTIRQAIDTLVDRGLLTRIQGRGTFVVKTTVPFDLHKLTSFSEDMIARGKIPSSKILSLERCEPIPAAALALQTTDTVIRIKRLRFASGKVVGIHVAYVPGRFDVEEQDLFDEPSLYKILTRKHKIEMTTANETLQASVADEEDSRLLECELGAPIMHIERTSYSRFGKPAEFCVIRYRGADYLYYVRLK